MAYKLSDRSIIDGDLASKLARRTTVFTASGTFAVPTGVNTIHAYVFGGGGGGSAGSSVHGGYGGAMYKAGILVTPSSNISITVGAGGTLSNTTDGTAGGASSFTVDGTTYQANGGTAGAGATDGTGSNGDVNSNVNAYASDANVYREVPGLFGGLLMKNLKDATRERPRGTGNSAGASLGGVFFTYHPGARGLGESSNGGENSSGGEGGAVILYY
jgi:hypothetical protein